MCARNMEAEWSLPRLITMGCQTLLSRISMEVESSLACSSAMTFSSLEPSKFPWDELVSILHTQDTTFTLQFCCSIKEKVDTI